ncbi:MAG: helix-turn-helix transcriptional regulator [Treponema sp.]|nr:helix-turn-helix transcriptional regulator [Treponema sp.]
MNAMELANLYGRNIKNIRQSKNMSQDILSEKAEISPGFLSEIENHKKTGTFDTLAKIAEALEVEPYELLLPETSTVTLDSRKTKQLMKQLRKNIADTMDTIEGFLAIES